MQHQHDSGSAIHGMLVVGEKTVYLSHLPMFSMRAHAFQVILEVTLTKAGGSPNAQAIYVNDRKQNPDVKIYTLEPTETFALSELAPDATGHARRRSFDGQIVRGHFEREGHATVPDLDSVAVGVTRVVHFHGFDPKPAVRPPLEYLLFGKGDELFVAHTITMPPDFDHVLSVRIDGHRFTDDELGQGVRVAISGSPNSVDGKLEAGKVFTGTARPKGSNTDVTLQIQPQIEFYFEAGELEE
jgi:hypothetical protein